jgi:hypothetical protein
MPQDLDSDELLVRYHLGELSPVERDAVEDRYFADDAFHEQVLAAEEELIDSYVRGELSTEQRKHFESWFLQADDRRQKLEFAKALAKYRPAQNEPRVFRAVKSVLQAYLYRSTGAKRPLFDAAYLQALTQGDPNAENDLINHFSRPVRLKLKARLRSAELVEQARQLVFERVLAQLRYGILRRFVDGVAGQLPVDRVLAELRSGTRLHPGFLRRFVYAVCDDVALDTLLKTHYSGLPPEFFQDDPFGLDFLLRTYSGGEIPPDAKRQLEILRRKVGIRKSLAQSMHWMSEKDWELLGRVMLNGEDKDVVCRELGVDRSHLRDLVHQVRHHIEFALVQAKSAGDRATRVRWQDERHADARETPKRPGSDRVK